MMQVLQGPDVNHVHNTAPDLLHPPMTGDEGKEKPKKTKMHPVNSDFAEMLEMSGKKLKAEEMDKILEIVEFSEAKVYESITAPPTRYLRHVLSKRDNDTLNKVQSLAEGCQLQIQTALYASDLAIRKKPRLQSIKKKQQQLSMKLSQVGQEMGSLTQLINKDDIQAMMNGKYWQPNSKGTEQARQFVKKLRQKKKQARQRRKEERAKSQQQLQLEQKRRQEEEEKKLQQRIKQSVQKLKEYKKHRDEQKAHLEQRIKNEQALLQKYRSHSLQVKHKSEEHAKEIKEKEQLQRIKKLRQLKKKYRPMDSTEMEEHQRQYLQRKNKMQEQINRRLAEGQMLGEKEKEELAKLYKCHYHQQLSKEEQKPVDDRKQRGKSMLEKIASFQQNVLSEYRPRIDEKKRREMKELIQEVDNRGKRGKVKVLDNGQVVFEETVPQLDHRKLGVQYLEQLRKMHSQRSARRQETHEPLSPNSLMKSSDANQTDTNSALSAKDYLHEGVKGLKSTLSKWKRDLNNEQLPRDQRYSMVLKKVEVIDEVTRQKQEKLKLLKDQPKQVMEIKQSLDKHYLNSINAKLGVLNKIIYSDK